MGCKFCMTGRQGFHGNLSAADILSQLLAIDEAAELTNVVFMGMGEPLDNWEQVKRVIDVLTADWGYAWSPKRITLSTIGVIPSLKRFLDECRCHLAVSLHDPCPPRRPSRWPMSSTSCSSTTSPASAGSASNTPCSPGTTTRRAMPTPSCGW